MGIKIIEIQIRIRFELKYLGHIHNSKKKAFQFGSLMETRSKFSEFLSSLSIDAYIT